MMAMAVQELQRRGGALWTALSRLPPRALTADCRARLLKAVHSERTFVDRLAGTAVADAHLASSNFGHLEGILYVLQNQSWRVTGATAALKSFQAEKAEDEEGDGTLSSFADDAGRAAAHVDLVCSLLGESVWVVVVNSSPHNRLWHDKKKRKGLRTRVASLLRVASSGSAVQPSAILLLMRDGLDARMEQQLQEEFEATRMSDGGLGQEEASICSVEEVEDGEWANVHLPTRHWVSYWIGVTRPKCAESFVSKYVGCFGGEYGGDVVGSSSCWAAIMRLQVNHEEFEKLQQERRIVNLDTTALVAVVSELSNGGAEELVRISSEEREKRFPGMAKFVYEQALVELDEPFLPHFEGVLSDKLPVICEYVCDEFTSITLTNGGPREKQRAHLLLSRLKVVRNLPSARVDALPETGKIKPRHKIVFGSGDYLQAPTVTANMSFVRAVQQQGVALAIVQHQPCALTGD